MHNSSQPKWLTRVLTALAALTLIVGVTTDVLAAPGTLVVEGALTSTGGVAADGNYIMTFSLYSVPTGGTAAWKEGPNKVAVTQGRFIRTLGKSKPLTPGLFKSLKGGWLGVKIDEEKELPRTPLHSVAWALQAASAEALSCSGCVDNAKLAKGAVGADKVGFPFAGAKTKGGPANSALDLQCTGCVTVAEMKFDKDIDLGGNALKAKKLIGAEVAAGSVTANTFAGDGSKLTGIKTPAGTCKNKGEVVKGINPDGSLACVKAMDPANLPPDAIDEISNYLIHNQFIDKAVGKKVGIPDNNPTGVSAELTFPDIGLAQKLDVHIDLTNSDLKTVTVTLFDPNNAKYTLYDKGKSGTTLKAVYPSKDKPVSGDLTTWHGKNPKGKWRLQIIDVGFKNNGTDGALNAWSVEIQTLSNKKVQIKGNLIVDGTITSPGGLTVKGDLTVTGKVNGAVHSSGAVYTHWGRRDCPAGQQKFYDGLGWNTHHSHGGAADPLCLFPGDPGPSHSTSSADLLYAMYTDHVNGTSLPGARQFVCAKCYTPDKGPCWRLDGSETCPKGFKAAYQGYLFGGHHGHKAGQLRICADKKHEMKWTSSGANAAYYATRLHAGTPSGPYTGKYPSSRSIKCAVCCRE